MRWGPDEELVKCFTPWKRYHKFAKPQTSKPTIHGMRGIVCLVELALRAFLTKDKSADRISHHCFWLPPRTPSPVVASFVSGNCINLTIPLSAIIFHLIMSLLCRGLIFASEPAFQNQLCLVVQWFSCVWWFNVFISTQISSRSQRVAKTCQSDIGAIIFWDSWLTAFGSQVISSQISNHSFEIHKHTCLQLEVPPLNPNVEMLGPIWFEVQKV